jgi:hypothetical protein
MATDRYRGSFNIRVIHSAATAAPAIIWVLRNPSALVKVIPIRLRLEAFFQGTAAATLMWFELLKGIGVTAYTGSPATVTASEKVTSLSSLRNAECKVLDTGMGLTGVTLGAKIDEIVMSRVPQSTTQPKNDKSLLIDFPSIRLGEIELAQNEVLAIRTVNNAVINDTLVGRCEFAERLP